jgi:hypothetical protein
MARETAIRESYECPVCGFTQHVYVPVLEVFCPNEHPTRKNGRTIRRLAMTRTYKQPEQRSRPGNQGARNDSKSIA